MQVQVLPHFQQLLDANSIVTDIGEFASHECYVLVRSPSESTYGLEYKRATSQFLKM